VAQKTAIIVGAGPAGLTAAYELLERSGIVPVVLERSDYMGGISRTVNYKGNRIDIGGHRFFSKSDRVMRWWLQFLPLQKLDGRHQEIAYQNQKRTIVTDDTGPDPEREDLTMLVRNRLSRIYFLRKFFAYPITLSGDTLKKLGPLKTLKIGASYVRSMVFPIRHERNLEEFFVNRFGRELYRTFFKSYTEKVWGVSCKEISAEWGAQRIKGLSILKALQHMFREAFAKKQTGLSQKEVETSLIDKFLYPKFGPGQMWEEVARRINEKGGRILTGWTVGSVEHDAKGRVTAVSATHLNGETRRFEGDYFFSTMPVKELVGALAPSAPAEIKEVADGLQYRDFITVGLLCNDIKIKDSPQGARVKDNWIYIQEPDVLVGRLQIFNNWSPYMVADSSKTWIGLEYFCFEDDALWRKSDEEMIDLAKDELARIGILDLNQVVDGTVIRMPKTYPAYFGTYARFSEVIQYMDGFENLYLVGRNGMHKYNNQDHSMLAAMVAVDNILNGVRSRDNLWSLNTEQEYHEDNKDERIPGRAGSLVESSTKIE
jgi:protoporphyrinogen oxidase